jgi:hypothetical protein
MSANVEILVSDDAAKVKKALGPLPLIRFATEPSHHVPARLLLAWLTDLDSSQGRRRLEHLWEVSWKSVRDVPLVFVSFERRPRTEAAFQALAHWSRLAAREPFIAREPAAIRRMVLALQSHAETELIASATIEDGNLVVWSCEPARYEVPVAEIPALERMGIHALADFQISPSGSRIHWAKGDVDIDLDTIRERADPGVRRAHEARARKEAVRYSGAIRRFREERRLKQTDIRGLSERQVRRLEEGDTIPHVETLRKLATAHTMSVDDYLKELAKWSRTRPEPSGPGRHRPKAAKR